MAFLRTFSLVIRGTSITLFVRFNLGPGFDFITSLVSSINFLIYMISPIIFGNILHRINRRKLIIISSFLTLVSQIIYLSFWLLVGTLGISIIVIIFIIMRASDGFFMGLYYPVLQSRLSDEKNNMKNSQDHERYIRGYNLGWNGGIVIGSISLMLVTIPSNYDMILDLLFLAMVITGILLGINLILGIKKFRDVRIQFSEKNLIDNSVVKVQVQPKIQVLKKCWIALLIIITISFTIGQTGMTIMNQFTAISLTSISLNLIFFISFFSLLRAIFQTIGSSSIKIPKQPETRYPKVLIILSSLFLLMGCIIILFPNIGIEGLILISLCMIPIGLFFGIMYATSLAKVINDSKNDHPEFFQSLFESIQGLGIFLGQITSGAITEQFSYSIPYFLNVVLILVVFVFSLLYLKKSQSSRSLLVML